MAHPLKPAESSAHKFGGRPEDYLTIHNWFDESKSFLGDFRHRALRHHTEGIFLAERIFGVAIKNKREGGSGSDPNGSRLAVTNQTTALDVRPDSHESRDASRQGGLVLAPPMVMIVKIVPLRSLHRLPYGTGRQSFRFRRNV